MDGAFNANRMRVVEDITPDGGELLDVGCIGTRPERESSEPWLHDILSSKSADIVGIDIASEEVRELRSEGYDIVEADAEQFELGHEFDTVVASELIEHLSNPGQFLDRVRSHLKPDGRLILSTPNPWGFSRIKRAVRGKVRTHDEHICYFDERTLDQLLERHGFAIEACEYVEPPGKGITWLLHRLGFHQLGTLCIVVVAAQIDD